MKEPITFHKHLPNMQSTVSYARAHVPSRRKQFRTSRLSTFENHNFIRARGRNADCKTGFSIPVSETKFMEVVKLQARWVDVHDGTSSTSLIGYRESLCEYRPGRVYGAQRRCNKEMHRATRYTALICISQLPRENSDGKKEPLLQASTLFFIRKTAYANAIIDIGV